VFLREAATDVGKGSGEGAACLALRPVAPEEVRQPLPGLGLLAMEKQIG
jgi:hypothetical protein